MKYIVTILLLMPLFCEADITDNPFRTGKYRKFATTYYVSTSGNDANPGTIGSPFKNWEKLSDVMVAGDNAYIRGGTYLTPYTASQAIHCELTIPGTISLPCVIENYPGESPVFDLSSLGEPSNENPIAVYVNGSSYLTIKGLRVTGLEQNQGGSGISWGWLTNSSPNVTHEQIEVDHIGGYGFKISGSNDNTYLNCDSHHNADPWSAPPSSDPYGGSDGFGGTGGETSTNTVYNGCRAWWNSDDGWDYFGTDGVRTMINCWSFWNGYIPGTFTTGGNGEGFKLGPMQTQPTASLTRILIECVAFENRGNGFSQNTAQTRFQFWNCTSYNNVARGWWMAWYPSWSQDVKNNIGYDNPGGDMDDDGGNAQGSFNTWNVGTGVTVTDADFVSVSSTGVDGARQSNGDLPVLTFLHLVEGSDLRGAGTELGYGTDLGAFQYEAPSAGTTFRIRQKIRRQ